MKELFQIYRSGLTYAWDNAKIVTYIALILFPIVLLSSSNLLDHLLVYPIALAFFAIFVVVFRIIIGGGISGIINESIPHQPTNINNLLHYGIKYFSRLLALFLIYVFSLFLIAMLFMPFDTLINSSYLMLSFAITVAIAIIYYLSPIFLLSYFAIICEDRGVIASIKRGYQLCGQNYARIKIIGLILMYLLTFVLIGMGLGMTLSVFFDYYLEDNSYITESILAAFLTSFGMVGFSSIFIPFFRKLARVTRLEDANNRSS